MRVKKIYNNNVLCAVDDKGDELILSGVGIGFGKHIGETVDEKRIDKTYRMVKKNEQRRLRELVAQIPIEDLELTRKLVQAIKKEIQQPLNESLLITLADHISFALKRKKEGIEFTNPLSSAIMSYYPTEYQLGLKCLKVIQKYYGVELIRDEGAFIALHIVNAELNTDMSAMIDMTKMLDDCIALVESYYGRTFDRDSLDFSRFVIHLRYFAQRMFRKQGYEDKMEESDVMFRQMIAFSYKKHYRCAEQIAEYMKNVWDKDVSDEEKVYLTIHMKRINSRPENTTE